MHERRMKKQKSTRITDYALTYLEEQQRKSGRYNLHNSHNGKASLVSYNTGHTEAVDLPARHCTCDDFQELELPCRHAQQVCRDQNLEREDYVSKSYILEEYRVIYLAFLPSIKPDDIPKDPTCNAPPR